MKSRALILTALFAALTAVGAFLRIPLGVSSVTLQFFFTAMAGVLLGPRWGAASQAVYVLLGLAGLPVFTLGGGFAYVLQPTFGFVLGLIPAAWVMGLLGRKTRPLFAILAGMGTLYALGLPYMALILNVHLGLGKSLSDILWAGLLPFLPADAVKVIGSALLCRRLLPMLKNRI